MPKLTRGLVLGAMLAVLSSATAAVAQPPDSWNEAIGQYRAGERASMDQSSAGDGAVEQFRAGERASMEGPIPEKLTESSEQPDQPVGMIIALVAIAVLAQTLDAMSVRRKARKAAYPAI